MKNEKLKLIHSLFTSEMIHFYIHKEGCDFFFHRDNLCDFSESTKSMLLKFSKCANCGNNIKKNFSPCECTAKDNHKDWVTGYRITHEQYEQIEAHLKKDRRRAYGRKAGAIRRKRLSKAEGNHTGEDIYRLWELQNRKCYFCWRPLWVSFTILGETKILPAFGEYEVEHLTPISKSGTNWPYNIALTCKECNQRKSDRSEAFFWRLLEKKHGEKWVSEHKARATKNREAKRKLTNIRKKELERKRQKSCNRGKIGNGVGKGKS